MQRTLERQQPGRGNGSGGCHGHIAQHGKTAERERKQRRDQIGAVAGAFLVRLAPEKQRHGRGEYRERNRQRDDTAFAVHVCQRGPDATEQS